MLGQRIDNWLCSWAKSYNQNHLGLRLLFFLFVLCLAVNFILGLFFFDLLIWDLFLLLLLSFLYLWFYLFFFSLKHGRQSSDNIPVYLCFFLDFLQNIEHLFLSVGLHYNFTMPTLTPFIKLTLFHLIFLTGRLHLFICTQSPCCN